MLKINLNIWVTDLASFHSKPISITDSKCVVQGALWKYIGRGGGT